MENPIIAVFTETQREFEYMQLRPKKLFRRIERIRDIRASKFIGIIECGLWWHRNTNTEMYEAYQHLRMVLPNLFDKN